MIQVDIGCTISSPKVGGGLISGLRSSLLFYSVVSVVKGNLSARHESGVCLASSVQGCLSPILALEVSTQAARVDRSGIQPEHEQMYLFKTAQTVAYVNEEGTLRYGRIPVKSNLGRTTNRIL